MYKIFRKYSFLIIYMKENVYTIVDYPNFNMESGAYKAKAPLAAAKKAFTRLQKKFDLKNNTEQKQYIEFTLRNKSTNQFYTYLGTKVLLHSAITLNHNGKRRTINYKHLLSRKPPTLNVKNMKALMVNYNRNYNQLNNNSFQNT